MEVVEVTGSVGSLWTLLIVLSSVQGDCPTGKFGKECSQRCSHYCKNIKCDIISGKCTPCRNGHIGDTCTDCPPGTYGDKCLYRCPEHCSGNVCHPSFGTCMTCDEGYSGLRCEVSDDQLPQDIWLYGSVFAAFALLSVVFMFLVCETKPLPIYSARQE